MRLVLVPPLQTAIFGLPSARNWGGKWGGRQSVKVSAGRSQPGRRKGGAEPEARAPHPGLPASTLLGPWLVTASPLASDPTLRPHPTPSHTQVLSRDRAQVTHSGAVRVCACSRCAPEAVESCSIVSITRTSAVPLPAVGVRIILKHFHSVCLSPR